MKRKIHFAIIFLSIFYSISFGANNQKIRLKIFLSSNLQGSFLLLPENGKKDYFLQLGRAVIQHKPKTDLFLDMGNAFYPGILSRYSHGALVMDFFHFFGFHASLVSSQDVRLGLDTLRFLSQGKKFKLLSSNIEKAKKPFFLPYLLTKKGPYSIAVIGISSEQSLIDLTEKKARGFSIRSIKQSLQESLTVLKAKNIRHFILLSGLSPVQNTKILKSFPEFQLIISSSDQTGEFSDKKFQRLEFSDGRNILFLPRKNNYYTLELKLTDSSLEVKKYEAHSFNNITKINKENTALEYFGDRLKAWRSQFIQDQKKKIYLFPKKNFLINGANIAAMLLDAYSAEVCILHPKSLSGLQFKNKIGRFDIIQSVSDEYSIFTYYLSGSELLKAKAALSPRLQFHGIHNDKVQDYSISSTKKYRIVSTQWVYESISKLLTRNPQYDNQWKNIPELIEQDLTHSKNLLRKELDYPEKIIRFDIEGKGNFFAYSGTVKKGKDVSVPSGGRENDYYRWGTEVQLKLRAYNRWHNLILEPYLYYIADREEGEDIEFPVNIFRGTLTYYLNIHPIWKPYHKFKLNTVLRKNTEDLWPVVIRDTTGITFETELFSGKIGIGFEKPIQDPVDDSIYGLETIINFKWNFWEKFSVFLNLDLFVSKKQLEGWDHARSILETGLSFQMNSWLAFSVKHRWRYYYSSEYDESYSSSEWLGSLNINFDLKFY